MTTFYQAHQLAFTPIKKGDENAVCDFDDDLCLADTNTQTIHHTNNSNVRLISLTATADNAPDIWVCASIDSNTHTVLQLSYFIESTPWLSADFCDNDTMTIKPIRQDFLWENNCLECFFDLKTRQKDNADSKKDNGYFELNIATKVHKDNDVNKVAFNLYQFNDYRTPNTLPPPRADGQITHFAMREYTDLNCFNLTKGDVKENMLQEASLKTSDLKKGNFTDKNFYGYHIALALDESVFLNNAFHDTAKHKLNNNECNASFIDKIHPCVILYHDKQPIYYAAYHANPPDFHDKTYWQIFNNQYQ